MPGLAFPCLHQRRHLGEAALGGQRVARGERIARRRVVHVGWRSRDLVEALALPVRLDGGQDLLLVRERAQQAPGIGAARVVEDGAGRAAFHDAAAIHDLHIVGEAGDHAHVMGDPDHRHAQLALEVAHQVQHLRLHRHVQRGGGLVGDQQLGLAGDADGDHRALPHAAGELVWILLHALVRVGNADQVQQLHRAPQRRAARQLHVPAQGFADLVADGENRVQRGHRVLEDHADLATPQLLEFRLAHGEQVAPLEERAAGGDAPRRLGDQPQHGKDVHALARAALAHDAQRLAGL